MTKNILPCLWKFIIYQQNRNMDLKGGILGTVFALFWFKILAGILNRAIFQKWESLLNIYLSETRKYQADQGTFASLFHQRQLEILVLDICPPLVNKYIIQVTTVTAQRISMPSQILILILRNKRSFLSLSDYLGLEVFILEKLSYFKVLFPPCS